MPKESPSKHLYWARYSRQLGPIDRIEHDVAWLKYMTYMYKMAYVHVRVCVRACAVEIKTGMLRAACFYDVRVWTRVRFALQDGDFS